MLARRMSNIDPSGVRRIFSLASRLDNPLNFSIGQADADVPDEVKEEAIRAIREGLNRYTPTAGFPKLREAIAAKLANRNAIKADPNDVLVTAGVSGGLNLSFGALLDPGDELIIPDPYFVLYKELAKFFDGVPRFVDTYPTFDLKASAVEAAITAKTKAILINSPNNPTGAVIEPEEMEKLAHLARRHDLLVISDEIYEDFIYDREHVSIGSIYEKTLTLNGFSKSHAMPGWRLGYAHGPRELIDAMSQLQQYSFVCAPSFAQIAAVRALETSGDEIVTRHRRKRDMVVEALSGSYRLHGAQGAIYVFPEAPGGDADAFVDKAVDNNVFIVPGSTFSERRSHFRLCYAAADDVLAQGLEILKKLA